MVRAPENLKEFPKALLADAKRRSLRLHRAFDWRVRVVVPNEIGKLPELRELYLGGNTIRELPESVGKLTKLEVLEVSYSGLMKLPASLGKLRSLRKLQLSRTERLKELPKSIGGCASLESLDVEPSGLRSVPATLWSCTKLRELQLPDGVRELPAGISKLTKLERLRVHSDALWSIREELPELTSLRHLRVWGKTKRLPAELGALSKLRELEILYTENVTALPESVSSLRELVTLDVSGCGLVELSSIVAALPKLKKLDYGQNRLPLAERRRLDARMRKPRSKAKPLGQVLSINAYLAMLLVDASFAKAWTGSTIGKKLLAPLEVGSGKGLAISAGIGHGISTIYRLGDGLALVESFLEGESERSDPLYLEWVVSPPGRAKAVGRLEVPSGTLVIAACGSNDSVLRVRIPKGNYEVLVEGEVARSFGSARRIIVRPTGPTSRTTT